MGSTHSTICSREHTLMGVHSMRSIVFVDPALKGTRLGTFISMLRQHIDDPSKNTKAIRAFVAKHPELVWDRDPSGNTALHYAVRLKARGVVSILLGLGAEFDCTNEDGKSPMILAAEIPDADMVMIFINHKQSHRHPDRHASTHSSPNAMERGGPDESTSPPNRAASNEHWIQSPCLQESQKQSEMVLQHWKKSKDEFKHYDELHKWEEMQRHLGSTLKLSQIERTAHAQSIYEQNHIKNRRGNWEDVNTHTKMLVKRSSGRDPASYSIRRAPWGGCATEDCRENQIIGKMETTTDPKWAIEKLQASRLLEKDGEMTKYLRDLTSMGKSRPVEHIATWREREMGGWVSKGLPLPQMLHKPKQKEQRT